MFNCVEDLPTELLEAFFAFLDHKALSACRLVCKRWEILCEPAFAKKVENHEAVVNLFGKLSSRKNRKSVMDYKRDLESGVKIYPSNITFTKLYFPQKPTCQINPLINLKKLKIREFVADGREHYLLNYLHSHAHSLTSLEIEQIKVVRFRKVFISFPPLPKLRKLRIGFGDGSETLKVRFTRISLIQHFPCLEEFGITGLMKKDQTKIAPLLYTDGGPHPGVTSLQVPSEVFAHPLMATIIRYIFPNVEKLVVSTTKYFVFRSIFVFWPDLEELGIFNEIWEPPYALCKLKRAHLAKIDMLITGMDFVHVNALRMMRPQPIFLPPWFQQFHSLANLTGLKRLTIGKGVVMTDISIDYVLCNMDSLKYVKIVHTPGKGLGLFTQTSKRGLWKLKETLSLETIHDGKDYFEIGE